MSLTLTAHNNVHTISPTKTHTLQAPMQPIPHQNVCANNSLAHALQQMSIDDIWGVGVGWSF